MATTLYLQSARIALSNIGVGQQADWLDVARDPAGLSTLSVTTVSGAGWVSFGYFATRALQPFTLSGSVSFNFWGDESNNTANASLGLRVYKWNGTTGQSALLGQALNTSELITTPNARAASVTPTSTAFASGDLLVVDVGAINVGTMGGGRAVNLYIGGATAGANGDSYITLTENIAFKHRVRNFG